MDKENWKIEIEDCLNDLIAYQEINNVGFVIETDGEYSIALTELFCQLFDDTGLSSLLENGLVYAKKNDLMFEKLRELSNHIDFDAPLNEILISTQWSELKILAQNILLEIKTTE